MKLSTSAFMTRLERLAPLSDSDRKTLQCLEQSVEQRDKRSLVFDPLRPDNRIAIIRSGWAATRVQSVVGQTTIAHIYMAGDMIGVSDFGLPQRPHETTMQTDGSVSLISRDTLVQLAATNPRLFRIIVSLANLNTVALMDRLHSVTRYSAEDRLMHFLLTIKAKTEHSSDQPSDRFPLPLSQKEIGDVLGLTDIYVNRLLSGLQKRGELTLSRPNVRITNSKFWEDKLRFQNRYGEIDLDWVS